MEGMGGMPGMGGGRRRKHADNSAYYKLLNVEKDASPSEIKKSYRKLAMKNRTSCPETSFILHSPDCFFSF